MSSIFDLLYDIISLLAGETVSLINYLTEDLGFGLDLTQLDFNLTLFSDTSIISTNMHNFLSLFFAIFYSMFFIVLLYKATKKFITMIFGVFRV